MTKNLIRNATFNGRIHKTTAGRKDQNKDYITSYII